MGSYQSTSTSTSYSNDSDLVVNSDLVLTTNDNGTSLLKDGNEVASVSLRDGEHVQDKASFATAVEVVSLSGSTPEYLALVLYAALRKARVELRTAVIASYGALDSSTVEMLGLKPLNHEEVLAGRLDIILYKLSEIFETQIPIEPMFYVREVSDTVRLHVKTAFQRGFFAEVGRNNVSKEQYIYVMSQQHAYVKYTTRILGYCVSYGQTSALRSHFIKHLSEEINHEKIIEADLAHLGADVHYVVNNLEPNVSTQHFTLGELALVSHFHDPILLTAAPIAAEGLTAHLDRKFITDLNLLIADWGIDKPEKASRFLSSHIDFDAGDDGHFEGTMRMLGEHLTNERILRRFVSALHAQMASFLKIYELAMQETAIWGRNKS